MRQFSIPAYQVVQDDMLVLRDIFDRMNNYGKRLSRAEIFSALNAGRESDAEHTLTIAQIADHVDDQLGSAGSMRTQCFGPSSPVAGQMCIGRSGPSSTMTIGVVTSNSATRIVTPRSPPGRTRWSGPCASCNQLASPMSRCWHTATSLTC
ncbi:MAG: hypothetical protein WCC65_18625 [Pseudonocardiaceae bacterium]